MASSEQLVMLIHPEDVRRSHELLGRGTYGTVYKGRWQGMDVAIKLFDAQREINSLQKEVAILAQCQHPNIVMLYGVWLGQELPGPKIGPPDYSCPYYVMELADSGTVADVVHTRPTVHYSIGLAFSWFLQCANAVAYLHAHQPRPIIHRDLKSMNLLLFNGGRVLKVCDFGTVREQSTDMTSSKGTVAWMAPEILTNSRYSTSVDVYSLGMVMWEVLARSRPFKDMNSYSIMFHIHAGQRPPQFRDCPETLRCLLAACLHQEPARRPAIADLVELLQLVAPRLPGYGDGLHVVDSSGVPGSLGGAASAAGATAAGAAASDNGAAVSAAADDGAGGGGGGGDTDIEVTEDPPPPTTTTAGVPPPTTPMPMPPAPASPSSLSSTSSSSRLPPPLPPRPRSTSKSPTPPTSQHQQHQQFPLLPLQVTNEPQLMPSLATPQDDEHQLELLRVILEELPTELHPPPALPGNAESEALFAEHQRMLHDYATEQMTLMRLTQEQKDLEQQLLQLVSPEQLRELLDLKLRLEGLRRRQLCNSTQRSLSAMELNHA